MTTQGTPNGEPKGGQAAVPKPYQVTVSIRFIVLTLTSSALLAFTLGRATRVLIMEGPRAALLWPHLESSMRNRPDYHLGNRKKEGLPLPQMMAGKEVPHTVYTSKNFDTGLAATSSSVLVERSRKSSASSAASSESQQSSTCASEKGSCSRGKDTSELPKESTESDYEDSSDDEDYYDEEDYLHHPSGQHLLVDIKDVDGNFLNSEERLAQAMVDAVADSKLTLLSYHCHTLVPNGVSCVGVLLESHISFHTWPNDGVITLDLFTCGSNPLIPNLKNIERLFAIPIVPKEKGEEVPEPGFFYRHKHRGFPPPLEQFTADPIRDSDLAGAIYGWSLYDMKKELVSVQTPFQQIDIYDLLYPDWITLAEYQKSLSNDGSYESQHPELYRPQKIVYLDGVMQSCLYGDAPYHESLVHPGMFAHPNPKRVAIIGGGEGATLREVLKHNTVEKCTMVEIDEMMVNVSHEYLPEWSDCSDLPGSADWCVEDPRADMRYEDAVAWFLNRFGEDDDEDEVKEEYDEDDYNPFDVIIMDALDPQVKIPFAEVLYQDIGFMTALYNAMTDNGIIVIQLGDAPLMADPPDYVGRNTNRARITELLQEVGFKAIHVYEEGHSMFDEPWSYLIAAKEYNVRANWYLNAAEVEIAIHKRIKKTKSGKDALIFFDGATMMTYQIPQKGFQYVYCRDKPTPTGCGDDFLGFRSTETNVDTSSFEVRMSEVGEHIRHSVFAKVDIPKGARIALDQNVKAIHASPTTVDVTRQVMSSTVDIGAEVFTGVTNLFDGYGCSSSAYGLLDVTVGSGIMTFVNNECNGAQNIGPRPGGVKPTESSVNPDVMTAKPFDIVKARHIPHVLNSEIFAQRDIKAGEEILMCRCNK